MKNYQLVVLGGTFDRLHAGHKSIIKSSLQLSENLIIGLTSDEYVDRVKTTEDILPFFIRKKELEKYLSKIGLLEKVEIGEIDRNEIPDSLQEKIEAIVVTKNTITGAEELNKTRDERGLEPLPIVVLPLVKDEENNVISSTRIRSGEIDQEEGLSQSEQIHSDSFSLPPALREELKKPLGKLIKNEEELKRFSGQNFVTVGDVTTKKFLDLKLPPKVAIVDFRVERKNRFSKINELGFSGKEQVFMVENPASKLTNEVFVVLSHIFNLEKNETFIVRVLGEEDLTVLPVILEAPIGFFVFYGQPNQGLVSLKIDERIKRLGQGILSQFQKKKD